MPVHDPFDPEEQSEEQRKREAWAQFDRDEEQADMAWLMSSKRGRRIVNRWLGYCGLFRPNFSPEALVMAHREGERSVGLILLAQVEQDPGSYMLMVQEHQDERKRRNTRNPSSRNSSDPGR